MTKEQLIAKLREMKQIKPRKDWVLLSRTQILASKPLERKQNFPTHQAMFSSIFGFMRQRKFAYTLAAFLFVVVGLFGLLEYKLPQSTITVARKPGADLVAENTLKTNVEDFTAKSQDLAKAVQTNPENVPSAIKEAKDATQNLTNTIQKYPELAGKVALDVNNNKTLLDIPGGDSVPGASELQSSTDTLEKVIDAQEIADLEKTTLTQDQQKALDFIKGFYNSGNYEAALQNILINFSSSNNADSGN